MDGTRQKTTKSLRSGKKIGGAEFAADSEAFGTEPEKKKRAWESWAPEDKYAAFIAFFTHKY